MRLNKKLKNAVGNGKIGSVIKLLEKGASVNARVDDSTLLHSASRDGYEEIVSTLISAGADVKAIDEDGRTPLHWARTPLIAQVLIEYGADVNAKTTVARDPRDFGYLDYTPLHDAAGRENRGKIIVVLVKAGADIEAKNSWGETPLHCAAGSGYVENVEALIDGHADLNAIDDEGRTPVESGMRDSWCEKTPVFFPQCIKTLVDAGAEISSDNRKRLLYF